MLEIVLDVLDKYEVTGTRRVWLFLRLCMVCYRVTVSDYIEALYHRVKGDYDAWLDHYFKEESNKRG